MTGNQRSTKQVVGVITNRIHLIHLENKHQREGKSRKTGWYSAGEKPGWIFNYGRPFGKIFEWLLFLF